MSIDPTRLPMQSEATQSEATQSDVEQIASPLDWILESDQSVAPAQSRSASSGSADSTESASSPTGSSSNNEAFLEKFLGGSFRAEAHADFHSWKERSARRLTWFVGEIDRLLNEQVNLIIHHPRFQKLESVWRGVKMLVDTQSAENATSVRIKILSVSWREIHRDFERANEFDGSHLFRLIYENEFGSPGGEPYGVMIGDYEIRPRPSADHPFDDTAILAQLAGVAAASFCPFITNAHPSMFGVDQFSTLEYTRDLARGFQTADFVKWRALRDSEDSRFVGLTLPRILMRVPYDYTFGDGFVFQENTSAPDGSGYLWGGAAFAFATVLIRSFAQTGWLADLRGVERNVEGGGLVTRLPVHHFGTDREGIAPKCSTDTIITDKQEAEFSRLGFIPLCHCHDTEYSAFYSNRSIQKPLPYDNPAATANANISSMLQYMLCVSRFSHFLKVMARDWIGEVSEPEELRDRLDRWIREYVTQDATARPEVKARRPLRDADIRVISDPSKPGTYLCSMNLWPHYQLDDLSASIRLRTTMTGNRTV